MRKLVRATVAAGVSLLSGQALWAQVPVAPQADHARLLLSSDPVLAANKRLVYDFWREVFEAGHLDRADRYLTESYIQHNPNVGSGREAFVAFFSKIRQPRPIAERVAAPLVSITAEGDTVILSFVRAYPHPTEPGRTYTTTWFDQFRLENGRIAEHWDPALKQ
jgi:predicted SnoaL-like aldol condensation-catalyzing enzyme